MTATEAGSDVEDLRAGALAVLRRNDLGDSTKAAPALYPHQWSWDAGFVAIGLAHVDPLRAARELRTLFAAQWANGKVPHIVYNPDAPPGSYVPSGDHWRCAALTPEAPRPPPRTSGLCQPPVHAIAAAQLWRCAAASGEAVSARVRGFLAWLYPRLLAWHRYLAEHRDPEQSGLVTIWHPWESGCDNAPRWDEPLAVVTPGRMPPYHRVDRDVVADAIERPTDEEYDRYLWLLHTLRAARYHPAAVRRRNPFLCKDVLTSALLVAANDALLRIGRVVGAAAADRHLVTSWRDRGRRGLETCWDPDPGLYVDRDLRSGRPLRTMTVAGFAGLVAGGVADRRVAAQLEALDSEAFCGHPRLRWALPPSTSPLDAGFRPRSYWRGPVWPVVNWLLWWALRRAGEHDRARRLRDAALDQLAGGAFPEYCDPFDGEVLGSRDQSWTAAVTLDWLAAGPAPRQRSREERAVRP